MVGIIARQRVEQVRLIVEKSMLQMDGERQRMQHQAARLGEVVNHLEGVALIKDMFRRSMVRREAVLPTVFRRNGVKIDIECQRSKIAVNVHAIIFEAQLFVQVARGGVPGTAGVDIDLKLLVRWKRTPKASNSPISNRRSGHHTPCEPSSTTLSIPSSAPSILIWRYRARIGGPRPISFASMPYSGNLPTNLSELQPF